MPIYEYHCPDCDTTFEQRRRFGQADDPLKCPECESAKAKRLLSRFMVSVGRGNGAASAGGVARGGCAGCAASSCAACRR